MKHFFVDSDGLSVNWQGYVLKNHFPNMSITELNLAKNRTQLLRAMYLKDINLFYNLEPLTKFKLIIQAIESIGASWTILTAIGTEHPKPSIVKRDKERSFAENFNIPPNKIVFCKRSIDKAKYANANSVLIDDYDKNCDAWLRHGGSDSILVESNTYSICDVIPRILNHRDTSYIHKAA